MENVLKVYPRYRKTLKIPTSYYTCVERFDECFSVFINGVVHDLAEDVEWILFWDEIIMIQKWF